MARPFPTGSDELTGSWLATTLGSSGARTPEVEVSRIGEGRGHMGSAFRIRVVGDEPADLPRSVVVKLPATQEEARQTADRGGLYEREVLFFQEIAPRIPMRVPGCHAAGYAAGEGFVLVLEDLGGATEIDQLDGLEPALAVGILEQLADFHAMWWESDELASMTWATRHTDAHRVANLTRILREGWPRLTASLADVLPNGCHEAGADMADLLPDAFAALANAPQTLLHGDVRLDNVLFVDPESPAVILDWQSVSRGAAVIDVAYFLAQNISATELEVRGGELLTAYRNRLACHGVEMDTTALRDQIALAMPLTFAVASSLFVLADTSDERTRELARVMATRAAAAVDHFGHPRDVLQSV